MSKRKRGKIGRMYAIPKEELSVVLGTSLTAKQRQIIDEGVKRTVKEYGQVLKKLGEFKNS